MDKIPRRKFIKNAVGAVAGTSLLSTYPVNLFSRSFSPNDTINLGIVGVGNHGHWSHLWNSYYKMEGVRIVALCDPDRAVLDREARKFYDKGEKVACYTDIRKLLENKDVDAISGATPNHWHALSTIWACQAGKDVCVEKPVSHNIWEGRKMVEAAEKYGRIVQADFDMRSRVDTQMAIDYIKSGALGKILLAHSWIYKRRKSIGKVNGTGYLPKTVDYDLWCGPAPKVPLPRVNLHYDWHWQWEYGNGEIGNNGPHYLDLCRWVLGEPGLASGVVTFGGRYGYQDDGETPNTSISVFDYETAPIILEVRGLPSDKDGEIMDSFRASTLNEMSLLHHHEGNGWNNGAFIVCEEGYVDLDAMIAYDRSGKQIRIFERSDMTNSSDNFIKALRSRREQDVKTPIFEGHISSSLCHMGNISYRVGSEVPYEEVQEVIKKDDQVLDAYEGVLAHLRANGVNIDKTSVTLGPHLTMDSEQERFVGQYADGANQYLKRSYREPYVVRDQV